MKRYLSIKPFNADENWDKLCWETEQKIAWFDEMGGTASQILELSGFKYACEYSARIMEDEKDRKNLMLATEVYVNVPEQAEEDRVFLYADDMEKDEYLYKLGANQEGRQVLDISELYELAGLGFHCIVCGNQEREGKRFVRYYNIFGDRFTIGHPKLWSEDSVYSGNGHNRLMIVNTRQGYLLIRPDYYAADTCANVLHSERQIRERIDASFSIERIDYHDPEVLLEMKPGAACVFLLENYQSPENYPECYSRLAYQTAYLKHYYAPYYAVAVIGHTRCRNHDHFRESICGKLGVKVCPPDINHSNLRTAAVEGQVIYEGFESGYRGENVSYTDSGKMIPSRESLQPLLAMIIRERRKNGLYCSTYDLISRICKNDSKQAVCLEALSRAYHINTPDGNTGMLHYALLAAGYNFATMLNEL